MISYREAEHAVLSYLGGDRAPEDRRRREGRRAEVAELFAATMLDRPGFFAAQDAQNLYTLAPIERAGCRIRLQPRLRSGHSAGADRRGAGRPARVGRRCGRVRRPASFVARDSARTRSTGSRGHGRPGLRPGWRLSHIVVRITSTPDADRPAKVRSGSSRRRARYSSVTASRSGS